MQITITQAHIAKGCRRNSACCPTALALLEHYTFVSVGVTGLNVGNTDDYFPSPRYINSSKLANMIRRYDSGDEFVAGTYIATKA